MKETLIGKGIGPEKFPGEFDLIAKHVSGWTKQADASTTIEPEEIKKMLNTVPTVTTWTKTTEGVIPIGFGAVTKLWSDDWAELGSVMLGQPSEQSGLGQYVVKSLIYLAKNVYPEKKFFSLCSEKNLQFFLDNGAKVVGEESALPSEVIDYKLGLKSDFTLVVI